MSIPAEWPFALPCALALLVAARALRARWLLSTAKHPSLAGHARLARAFARLVPYYEYDESRFFSADGAPAPVAGERRAAFEALAARLADRHPSTLALTRAAQAAISDLQFTSRYRVPFQFSRRVRERLGAGAFMAASQGVELVDLDGRRFYDLTGSYGVNVFGYDFYKECIDHGAAAVRGLGPVLGAYHPVVADNAARLLAICGLDEISFHMSGTEAVMQAVRLARYHTGRRRLVRFSGAYHGWWGDVQPGPGNPVPAADTLTLRDMDDASLRVLRSRRDVACVLVNPLQALHPNAAAAADSALLDGARRAGFDRDAYAAWLRALRAVCTACRIVLIFDEVFVGFRLALGGAQEYFGVRADLVTYGKTVAGGLPVGVLCGRRDLMRRFRADRPADVCFARGTFNSHPYVMGAMQAFLRRLETPQIRALYAGLDERWNARAAALNERFAAADLPLRVENLSTIWTIAYRRPSRYHWMLQYYLRDAGLALSWVGTGRLIFSLNYTDADYGAVADRIVAGAQRMRDDGWWWSDPDATSARMRRRVLCEMIQARRSAIIGSRRSPRSKWSGAL